MRKSTGEVKERIVKLLSETGAMAKHDILVPMNMRYSTLSPLLTSLRQTGHVSIDNQFVTWTGKVYERPERIAVTLTKKQRPAKTTFEPEQQWVESFRRVQEGITVKSEAEAMGVSRETYYKRAKQYGIEIRNQNLLPESLIKEVREKAHRNFNATGNPQIALIWREYPQVKFEQMHAIIRGKQYIRLNEKYPPLEKEKSGRAKGTHFSQRPNRDSRLGNVLDYIVNKGMPVTATELATELGVYPMTISRHLRTLEEKGVIERYHDENNKRALLVRLK